MFSSALALSEFFAVHCDRWNLTNPNSKIQTFQTNAHLDFGKLIWLAGKSPCSTGNTSEGPGSAHSKGPKSCKSSRAFQKDNVLRAKSSYY